MFKKNIFVEFNRHSAALLGAAMLFSSVTLSANELPSLAEARSQAKVWQGEVARAMGSGDANAIANARTELRNWEAIVANLVAKEKERVLLEEAKKNAGKAEQLAISKRIAVPGHLQGQQRTMFILRAAQRMEEQEKTERERAQQEQLKGQLRAAVGSGDYNRAKGFVSQGAKGDIETIQLAVQGGFTGIAYLLIKGNPDLQQVDVDRVLGKGLIAAAQAGDQERIANLVKLGADVNFSEGAVSAMTVAAKAGHMGVVNTLLAQGARRDPAVLGQLLLQAARKGDQNAVGNLLRMGANVNFAEGGKTPLTIALEQRDMGVANVLVRAGGDDPSGQYGKKLFDAALAGDMSWVNILSKIEKYRNYQNFQRETPLHAAASRGHSEAVTALLAAGADPNALTIKNWSPAHHAARFGHKLALIQILKGGGDVYAVNSDGNDAYKLASIAMRNPKIALDNAGILEYIRNWQQFHPRGSNVASN